MVFAANDAEVNDAQVFIPALRDLAEPGREESDDGSRCEPRRKQRRWRVDTLADSRVQRGVAQWHFADRAARRKTIQRHSRLGWSRAERADAPRPIGR